MTTMTYKHAPTAAHTRILMMGSVPLAAPWNGADKNLARLFVQSDSTHDFIVQTALGEPWRSNVHAVIDKHANPMPTLGQKLRALAYLFRWGTEADIVHFVASLQAPSRASIELMYLWKSLFRKPVVHTVPSIGDRPVNPRDFFADVTVVVSQDTRNKLVAAGVENVAHIPPALDPEQFQPKIDPAVIAAEFKLGPRPVLYPAHYGPASGIGEIIRAFARLPESLRDAVLVLACRSHVHQDAEAEAEKVRQQAAEAGIADRVRLISQVPDMAGLIQACAVTVLVPEKLASKMDLPMVVLESLLLRRPVIISDRPPIREALFGDAGRLVAFGDIDGLTHALQTVLENPVMRDQLGEIGHQTVIAQCSPTGVLALYEPIYRYLQQDSGGAVTKSLKEFLGTPS